MGFAERYDAPMFVMSLLAHSFVVCCEISRKTRPRPPTQAREDLFCVVLHARTYECS